MLSGPKKQSATSIVARVLMQKVLACLTPSRVAYGRHDKCLSIWRRHTGVGLSCAIASRSNIRIVYVDEVSSFFVAFSGFGHTDDHHLHVRSDLMCST